MADKTVEDLIRRARGEGLDLTLWQSRIAWRKDSKAPLATKTEVQKRSAEVKAALAAQLVTERSRPGAGHKWVLRLGDPKRSAFTGVRCRPPMLVCGAAEWCMRMVRQAREFGTDEHERGRWVILEADQVGAPVRNDAGVLVASLLVLPEGVELGGPEGAKAEIVSACQSCLVPPVDDERLKEVLKNEE